MYVVTVIRGQITLERSEYSRGRNTLEGSHLHDLLCSYGSDDGLHGTDIAGVGKCKTLEKSRYECHFLFFSRLGRRSGSIYSQEVKLL